MTPKPLYTTSVSTLQVGYIHSSNRMTYHQQKGRGYGHVTVLKFCRLPWCSASLGFVSDSWATCAFSRTAHLRIRHVTQIHTIRLLQHETPDFISAQNVEQMVV